MTSTLASRRARTLWAPLAAALFGLTAAPTVGAEEAAAGSRTFVIDPVHSAMQFKVRHIISNVPGHFADFAGTLDYDAGKPASLRGQATLQTASITTGNERRDNHLRSDDFFAAEKHPTIIFKSTKAEAVGTDKVRLFGDLTMRGVTKPIVLDLTILGVAPGMGGSTLLALEGTGTVNRKDFGISWDRTLDTGGAVVGDDVQMLIQIEAKYEPPKDEASQG